LFRQFGCHTEGQINIQMPGEKGMDDMRALMARLRAEPPAALDGLPVAAVRDYLNLTVQKGPGVFSPLDAPQGDLVILDLALEGNYLAVRPSGTEPKVKIYLFAYDPPEASADLDAVKQSQVARLKRLGEAFRAYAGV